MNVDNIFIAIDKEIYIDELILWLQDRKEKYLKLVPCKKENETVIQLVMKEDKKPLTKAEIEKLKEIKKKSQDKIIKK